jgi:hypothetical protein
VPFVVHTTFGVFTAGPPVCLPAALLYVVDFKGEAGTHRQGSQRMYTVFHCLCTLYVFYAVRVRQQRDPAAAEDVLVLLPVVENSTNPIHTC